MLEVKKGANSFYIGDSEVNPLAELTYVIKNDVIVADHTYVFEELNGQGVGKILLKEFINWARKENKKINPVCSYVKMQMEKNSEYQDMLYHR